MDGKVSESGKGRDWSDRTMGGGDSVLSSQTLSDCGAHSTWPLTCSRVNSWNVSVKIFFFFLLQLFCNILFIFYY